jgi:hypothetical protein
MKLTAVNDASSPETIDQPQDVTFYLTPEEAENYFEGWFSAHPQLVVDSDGLRYAFSTVGDRLVLTPEPNQPASPRLYRSFAEHMLTHYLTKRRGVGPDRLPKFDELSIDNLNALVYALLMPRKQTS